MTSCLGFSPPTPTHVAEHIGKFTDNVHVLRTSTRAMTM